MTTRKNQNSILVLATLGVYLGLVLVGATPQILANAALAKQFDIKDEIEFCDDLDNKPDDERTPVTTSIQNYLEDVEFLFASLGRLQGRGRFDAAKDSFDVAQSTLLPCIDANTTGRYTAIRFNASSDASRQPLEYFSRGMTYGYSLGDCVPNREFNGVDAVDSNFSFKLDNNNFTAVIAVKKQSPQRALELQREIESTLALFAVKARPIRKQVIENTKVLTENDLVFLQLHLPRSGIDPLLAANAK